MTLGQKIQLGFLGAIGLVGVIGPLFEGKWWQSVGMACLVTSSLLAAPASMQLHLLGSTPWQTYKKTRKGRGLHFKLAPLVLFFAGLALLLSGWFHK